MFIFSAFLKDCGVDASNRMDQKRFTMNTRFELPQSVARALYSTVTPFQKATWLAMLRAASFGSG